MQSCNKAKPLSAQQRGKKSIDFFIRYSGALKHSLMDDDSVWRVFFYLFEQKICFDKPAHCAYDICKSLNVVLKADPPLCGPKRLTEKCVSEALETLFSMKFVIKTKTSEHGGKKIKASGRPPKFLYESESIAVIIPLIKEKFQCKMQQAIDVFQPLQDMEEIAANKIEEGV